MELGDKIVAPLGINEVSMLIGDGVHDLGRLCQSDCINMWSKYRPIRCSGYAPINDSVRAANNWGYDFARYTDLVQMFNAAVALGGQCAWSSPKPLGAPNSPFRLTDFIGYEHYHYSWPFRYGLSSDEIGPYDELYIMDESDDDLTIEDFPNLADRHLGVAIRKHGTNGSPAFKKAPVGNIIAGINSLPVGEYDVCFFLTSDVVEPDDYSLSGEYFLVPYPIVKCMVSNNKGWDISGYAEHLHDDYLEFDLTIGCAFSRTITSVVLSYRKYKPHSTETNSPYDDPQDGEADISVGSSIIINQESPFEKHITIVGINSSEMLNEGKLYLLFNYGSYRETMEIYIESPDYE